MKILVVGGTGLIGGHGALYFKDKGHDVTIMARSKPKGTSALNELPFIAGNYVEDDFSDGRLNDISVIGIQQILFKDNGPLLGVTRRELIQAQGVDILETNRTIVKFRKLWNKLLHELDHFHFVFIADACH